MKGAGLWFLSIPPFPPHVWENFVLCGSGWWISRTKTFWMPFSNSFIMMFAMEETLIIEDLYSLLVEPVSQAHRQETNPEDRKIYLRKAGTITPLKHIAERTSRRMALADTWVMRKSRKGRPIPGQGP
jgi:hypothetical protein